MDTDDDQIFPSREAHLGQTTSEPNDNVGDQFDDVIYFINQHRQTGSMANLRTAHALLSAELMKAERCQVADKGPFDNE